MGLLPASNRLLPVLALGCIIGLFVAVIQVSFAALIFSGSLEFFLPRGIGICLTAAIVMLLWVALRGSLPGLVGMPQDSPAAILAAIVAGVVASFPSAAAPSEAFLTALAIMALSSLLTGITFYLLGAFRLGNIIRYIPYPVVGGFLAGTGWILFIGGINVVLEEPLGLHEVEKLLTGSVMWLWVPCLLFGIMMLVVLRRWSHFLLLPGMILGGTLLFYLLLILSGNTPADATEAGFLLGPFSGEQSWQPLTPLELQQIHWPQVLATSASISTIVVVSVVSLLLNASGMEMIARKDIDLDQELRANGVANLLIGLIGSGPVGYPALSLSALNYKAGTPERLVGIVAASVCFAALFFGAGFLSVFPTPILGGLLVFLGLSFLVEWLIDVRPNLSRANYLIILLILVSMASIGVLPGVAIGFVAAVFLFIADYSRTEVVRQEYDGRYIRSNVDRAEVHLDILGREGGSIRVVKLQGFLFFGSVKRLVDQIKERLQPSPNNKPVRFLILDFKHVSGMDASTVFAFSKLLDSLESHSGQAVFCSLQKRLHPVFERSILTTAKDNLWHFERDLDHALEWAENQILEPEFTISDEKHLLPSFFSRAEKLLEKRHFKTDSLLIEEGSEPDSLYFLFSGKVAVEKTSASGIPLRLGVKGNGAIFGEIALYTGQKATASVRALSDCDTYCLPFAAIKKLEETAPTQALEIHRIIARQISSRLFQTNRIVEVLSD